MIRVFFLAGLVALASSLTGCNNCEALTESICGDLGAEDCALWKEAKGPDGLLGGRRPGRACLNARFAPGSYTPVLTGAKNVAAGFKKVKEKQAEREKQLKEKQAEREKVLQERAAKGL